jgi:hypothetical protein
MTSRELKIAAGWQGCELVIRVTGSDCRCQDLEMLLMAEARRYLRERRVARPVGDVKPCGCQDAQ